MIDQWFNNDLQAIFDQHPVAVVIDETGDAEFLLNTVSAGYVIHYAHSDVNELHVKYLIEKAQPCNEKFLIYTRTNKAGLRFIREYCETCGCLEIRYLQNYIKDHVHQVLNLNINLSREELIAAAKVSIGKDDTYWMDISHKGASEIFDLNKELLPFIHDPETFSKEKYDAQLRETFYQKVNELLGQKYMEKPVVTLAGEVVTAMLDGLATGSLNKTLEAVYENWLDSHAYRDSFNRYLKDYALSTDLDIANACIHHPFRQVDEKWLSEIGRTISDTASFSNTLGKLRLRNQSRQALALGISFWGDVITLLEFDPKNIAYLSSFNECVAYYKKHFCKLDTAIRHLYTEFLNKQALLEPFQERYKELVSVFLDKWFNCFGDYNENQTGILQRIIDESAEQKIAVIVGDGVSYEIADLVAEKVKVVANLKKDAILADLPSETENNMSRIYMANGCTETIHSNREKYLATQNPQVSIDFIRLDEVNDEARPSQLLICSYKDIDDLGEKLQQKALKYIPETIGFFADKINHLLTSGYAKVYLISDHGFVLTGLLSEADKIVVLPPVSGTAKERYYISDSKQDASDWIVRERNGQYYYFPKSIHSLKSTGVYGYAHGGATPQELVTPCFCWERTQESSASLSVTIENKEALMDVTGDLFSIKLRADRGSGDLFSMDRKIYFVFFAKKVQINKSDVFAIHHDEQIIKEYTFDSHPELEIQILDAVTKQLLDRAIVKQNKSRDLGGLL